MSQHVAKDPGRVALRRTLENLHKMQSMHFYISFVVSLTDNREGQCMLMLILGVPFDK